MQLNETTTDNSNVPKKLKSILRNNYLTPIVMRKNSIVHVIPEKENTSKMDPIENLNETELNSTDLESIAIVYDKIRLIFK